VCWCTHTTSLPLTYHYITIYLPLIYQ
jgi:hypothetical protein